MNKRFSVEFFWKGEKRNSEGICEHCPLNDLDASGVAVLAIKSWFENQNELKPEIVRNVDFIANERSYHWDVLPL